MVSNLLYMNVCVQACVEKGVMLAAMRAQLGSTATLAQRECVSGSASLPNVISVPMATSWAFMGVSSLLSTYVPFVLLRSVTATFLPSARRFSTNW